MSSLRPALLTGTPALPGSGANLTPKKVKKLLRDFLHGVDDPDDEHDAIADGDETNEKKNAMLE